MSVFTGTADKNGIVTFKTIQLYEIEYKDGKISAKYLTVGKHLVELSTKNNVKSTKKLKKYVKLEQNQLETNYMK